MPIRSKSAQCCWRYVALNTISLSFSTSVLLCSYSLLRLEFEHLAFMVKTKC